MKNRPSVEIARLALKKQAYRTYNPDMEKKVLIATSGYSYADWKGVFYPEEMAPGDYLGYYAGIFPFTELNFSYYRQPEKHQSRRFLETTPESFLFSVKAHQSLTHSRGPDWKSQALSFMEGIRPLYESGRLALVILQFPFSFRYTRENRLYLGELCSFLEEEGQHSLPFGVEFRHGEWQNSQVQDELTRRKITAIIVDTPNLPGLPRPQETVTADTAYVRFHGQNRDNWWQGDNTSRYDYLYSNEQLDQWAQSLANLAGQVKRLFVAFNNHHKGQAVNNALTLTKKLETLLS